MAWELKVSNDHAAAVAAAVRHYIESMWDAELAIGRAFCTLATADFTPEQRNNLLNELAVDHPAAYLFVVENSGEISAATVSRAVGLSLREQDYVQRVQAGEDRVLSDLRSSNWIAEPVLILATAVRHDGKLERTVVATLPVSQLKYALPVLDDPRRNYRLVDSAGKLIFDYQSSSAPTGRTQQGSENHIGASAPIPGLGWTVMSSVPAHVVFRQARTDAVLEGLLLLLITGLSLFFGLRTINRFIGRLRALQNAAMSIAHGDLTARAHLPGDDELAVTGAVFDQMVDRIQQAELRNRHLATHDHLTDLLNRRAFAARLDILSAHATQGRTGAALFLDIDGFKAVNDTLGHAAGDALLVAFARRLQAAVGQPDSVFRLGGDEFAVLLADTTPEKARSFAASIRDAMRSHDHGVGNRDRTVTTSIGLVMIDGSRPSEEIIKLADEALYAAKRSGKDRLVALEGEEVG